MLFGTLYNHHQSILIISPAKHRQIVIFVLKLEKGHISVHNTTFKAVHSCFLFKMNDNVQSYINVL